MGKLQAYYKKNHFYIHLLLTCICAFAGGYFFLPIRGLVSTLPVMLSAALLATLTSIKVWQKVSVFFVFSFYFAIIEYGRDTALVFAGLFAVTVLVCSFAFVLIKKKKVLTVLPAIILLIGLVFPHSYFFGNYGDYIGADRSIGLYTNFRYPQAEFVVSKTFFDYKTGYYRATVYQKKRPTEQFTLSLAGVKGENKGYIQDGFLPQVKSIIMEDTRVSVIDAIREVYPNDSFDVIAVDINRFPDTATPISTENSAAYAKRMTFVIRISGQYLPREFADVCKGYYDAIMVSDTEFGSITFTGRESQRYLLKDIPYNTFVYDFADYLQTPTYISYFTKDPFVFGNK